MRTSRPFLRISQVKNCLTWRHGRFGVPGSDSAPQDEDSWSNLAAASSDPDCPAVVQENGLYSDRRSVIMGT